MARASVGAFDDSVIATRQPLIRDELAPTRRRQVGSALIG